MFYVGYHIQGTVVFQHNELEKLDQTQFITKRIKTTYEGRCLPELGFLVEVYALKDHQVQALELKVEKVGIFADLQFSAVFFKAQKGDIFDFLVDSISQEGIQGMIGRIRVIIPRSKTHDLSYNFNTNTYAFAVSQGELKPIRGGEYLRARVQQCSFDGDTSMQLFCETTSLWNQTRLWHY